MSQPPVNTIEVRLSDGVTLVVPADFNAFTTYILVEQETWFEKEMTFLRRWLKPGMTAIDIGANLGVYCVPIARRVAPNGCVYAYEPGSRARQLLEQSRELNHVNNLHIFPTALSDQAREGWLAFGVSTEKNALGEGKAGETVHITSLDVEDAARGWSSPDFVKIDAEGEEERILVGGRNFFDRHSPLIMFEIMSEDTVNERLRSVFPDIGYRLYRSLAGSPLLVPVGVDAPLDKFELNLFAAKSDRASSMAREGFLVEDVPAWEPGEDELRQSLALLQEQKYAPAFPSLFAEADEVDREYLRCLAAYAVWRGGEASPAIRCGALSFAYRQLRELCERAPNPARLSTFARVAWEWGQRMESTAALRRLLEGLRQGKVTVTEPFWPASPRFDSIAPKDQAGMWFTVAAGEQFQRICSFSSCFSGPSSLLTWLCKQPFASIEMERRQTLLAAGTGQRPAVPARLCRPAADHLNAQIWRSGRVPDTRME